MTRGPVFSARMLSPTFPLCLFFIAPLQAALLEVHFFPKWHAVLRHWLSSSPDYDEVTRWYLGWKALFPEEVLDTEKVRAQMALALNAMNTAVEGKPLPPTWTHPQQAQQAVPGSTSPQQHPTLEETYGAPHDHAAAAAAAAAAAEELSLRELVERFAEEVGVEFLPKPGRTHEGLQVYHFGLVSCVVDSARGLIRAQLDRAGGAAAPWQATSMEGLLQENERRQKAKRK